MNDLMVCFMDGQADGWMDEWTDRQKNGWIVDSSMWYEEWNRWIDGWTNS